MQLKLPFRLTRGVVVLLVIVFVHLVLAALFIGMRVEAPELGPVFATILPDSPDAARESSHPRKRPPPASKSPAAPATP